MRHMLELLFQGFGGLVLLCRGRMPRAQWMVAYVQDVYGAFLQPKFECGCEMLIYRICGVRHNLFVQSLPQP